MRFEIELVGLWRASDAPLPRLGAPLARGAAVACGPMRGRGGKPPLVNLLYIDNNFDFLLRHAMHSEGVRRIVVAARDRRTPEFMQREDLL